MKTSFVLFLLVVCAAATPYKDDETEEVDDIPSVEPEYLDQLLEEKRFDEFSYLMDLKDASMAQPREEQDYASVMMQQDFEFGDMLVPSKQTEEARQGIRFNKYGGSKWRDGVVPYVISNGYSDETKRKIQQAIDEWNDKVKCIHFVPRRSEAAYVMFFSGRGCYSILGRTGSQQPISLQDPGCIWRATILHEMEHAIGFAHEQNRSDRDHFIRILWDNIPESWKSQYKKTNPNDYGLQQNYDYYSIMHYGLQAPGTYKNAYEVLDKNIDKSKIGRSPTFTDTDLNKIRDLYC